VEWLLCQQSKLDKDTEKLLAYGLAQDFVAWSDGTDNRNRQQILDLFLDGDDLYTNTENGVTSTIMPDEEDNDLY